MNLNQHHETASFVEGFRPELLAPAGNLDCALAAFEGGADAIYAGLPRFNARERSENFTVEELAGLIEYARARRKKVFVTFNTLIKENELPDMISALGDLAAMEPDAVILQDIGVLRAVREYFPNLVIHASTQMGIHNSAGLRLAEELGVKRVILERQVTMEELAALRKSTRLELEVFVHGALCCSLSGQCLFSSWQGGYSGNRGKCKQPCRRRFYSRSGNGFFFSTQDLCTLEMIPQLRAMKIDSLKIEGRLRHADYVFNAVGAYRKMLDTPGDFPDRKVLGEARNMLAETCGRRWSQGFFTAESMKTLIQHDSLGGTGSLCGKVEKILENGFGFKTSRKIYLGDRVRVQPASGDEGPSLTVTKLFADNKPDKKALPGQFCFICCDKPVPMGGWVFKTGNTTAPRKVKLPTARFALDLAVEVSADEVKVEIANAETPFCRTFPVTLAPAEKHPVTPERIAEEFRAADSDTYRVRDSRVTVDGSYFFPAAELKRIRRAFFDAVSQEFNALMLMSPGAAGMERFRRDYLTRIPPLQLPERCPETVAVKPNGALPGSPKAAVATDIFDFNKRTTEVILPVFCPEGRLESLKKRIAAAYAAGIRRFRVQALFELWLLRYYEDIEITVSAPLPVTNSLAVKELSELHVRRVQAHVELERGAIEALVEHSVLPVEVYRFGRIPILTTRAAIPAEGEIKDARGAKFRVKNDKRSGLTFVYPAEIFSIPHIAKTYDFYDLREADWNNRNLNTFNFDHSLL